MSRLEEIKEWMKFRSGSHADNVRWLINHVEGLEERNNFLERAHKTNIKIAEYAKEENQRYKQALEEVKSLTINPREYQPSTYTIHHIVSDALKGVEG